MKKLLIMLPLTLILCFMVSCQDKEAMAELEEFKAQVVEKMVDVQGHEMHVQIAGMEKRLPGQPVVVLENGFGNTLGAWRIVFPLIAKFAPVFSYERSGIGQSELDGEEPTPKHIAERLHTLLQQIDIRPPYVMVGWSLGGPLIRMFAGIYPEEVAGMVYVDPKDSTATKAESLASFESIGGGVEGQKALKQLEEQFFQGYVSSPGEKAEMKMALDMEEQSYEEFRHIQPVPDIPVIMLAATKYSPMSWVPKESQLSFDLDRYSDALTQWRLEKLIHITREVSEGTFVMTGNSGHAINTQEPDLLVWAVARAVFPDIGRQIRRVINEKGMNAAMESYMRLKRFYPKERFHEGLLNTVGYEFLYYYGKVDEAVAIFELNVQEYPKAWDLYDGLAEGYMTQGNTEKAIASYKKSLELNPHNQNAVNRLNKLEKETDGLLYTVLKKTKFWNL